MRTVLSVVGARPQFVKAAPLSRRLRGSFREILVHTGQHYDHGLSAAFFDELEIPEPAVNLGVESASHARQTTEMVAGLLGVFAGARPDVVLVYGDTNTTLAAALAASRAGLRLAHVEAGLRSQNLDMPEEVNRIAADHLADLCLCPTPTAMENLEREGLSESARLVGDVMLDACLEARDRAGTQALDRLGVAPGEYYFATVHRAENTDQPLRLMQILEGMKKLSLPVVFPVHPRTRAQIERLGLETPPSVIRTGPLGYLDTISLVAGARKVLTDSGGLQKEAWFLGVPCVTLRDETEWKETIEAGGNRLSGATADSIVRTAEEWDPGPLAPDLAPYGGGGACDRIVTELTEILS
ncbi:MAG: non-hydrolyzing UDP-N-acetylglucosamine 2-epimerase [Planctomycetota bacterium]